MKRFAVLLLVWMVLPGCVSRTFSTTPRTAVEQLLLSAAVDRAVERINLPELSGKTVFLDFANLKAYDAEYIRVATRARFSQLGARLVPAAEGADYVAEIASGAFGLEYKTSVVGLPAFPVPNSPVPTPEVSAMKSIEQTAILKLLVFVHSNGQFVASYHYYAKADRDESTILWWRFQKADDIRSTWQKADVKIESRKSE